MNDVLNWVRNFRRRNAAVEMIAEFTQDQLRFRIKWVKFTYMHTLKGHSSLVYFYHHGWPGVTIHQMSKDASLYLMDRLCRKYGYIGQNVQGDYDYICTHPLDYVPPAPRTRSSGLTFYSDLELEFMDRDCWGDN